MSRLSVKKWLTEMVVFALLLTVVSVAVDLWRGQSVPDNNHFRLTAMDLNRQSIDIEAMSRERPVLVYFWASWCGACRFVTPSVNWLSQYYPTVGISLSSGDDEKLRRYFQHKNLTFQNINDPASRIAQEWGISFTPTLFVVRNGEVEFITTGITTPLGILARLWLA